MSTLFISYSTKDRQIADNVYDKLINMGYQPPFRDDHPDSGIPAGSLWERELYRNLRLCKALIILVSENWATSKWCFAELAYAKAMEKEVFPVVIQDSPELTSIVAERQSIKLSDPDAWHRLERGLGEVGLAPEDDFPWPVAGHEECPYPGLAAFESHHAGVYFGRDDEILEVRTRLTRMAAEQQPRLLYVVGASGSGKSSLVRAGLRPRLDNEPDRWCVLPTFRWNELRAKGRDWSEQLALDLATAWNPDAAQQPDVKALRDRYSVAPLIREQREDAAELLDLQTAVSRAANNFIADTKEVLATRPDATPLLIVDQFEELLSVTHAESAIPFLHFLKCIMTSPQSPWRCLATVRSDYCDAIQTRAELASWQECVDYYALPQMNPDRFYEVIRGPAEKVGINFESDALVDRIVKETGTNDALPLLAFTMRELYERFGDDLVFTVEEYSTQLGGLEGCLTKVANEVLKQQIDTERSDTQHQQQLLLVFSNFLVGVNDQGEFVRRTARWSTIPSEARPVLESFIERRLITSRSGNESDPDSERVVEVAHEALFRKWDQLARWLDARRDLLRWRADVERSQSTHGEHWSGLSKDQLSTANSWSKDRERELIGDEIRWITEARRVEAQKWRRLILVAVSFAVIAAIAALGWWSASIAKGEAETAKGEAEAYATELTSKTAIALLGPISLSPVDANGRSLPDKFSELGAQSIVELPSFKLEVKEEVLHHALQKPVLINKRASVINATIGIDLKARAQAVSRFFQEDLTSLYDLNMFYGLASQLEVGWSGQGKEKQVQDRILRQLVDELYHRVGEANTPRFRDLKASLRKLARLSENSAQRCYELVIGKSSSKPAWKGLVKDVLLQHSTKGMIDAWADPKLELQDAYDAALKVFPDDDDQFDDQSENDVIALNQKVRATLREREKPLVPRIARLLMRQLNSGKLTPRDRQDTVALCSDFVREQLQLASAGNPRGPNELDSLAVLAIVIRDRPDYARVKPILLAAVTAARSSKSLNSAIRRLDGFELSSAEFAAVFNVARQFGTQLDVMKTVAMVVTPETSAEYAETCLSMLAAGGTARQQAANGIVALLSRFSNKQQHHAAVSLAEKCLPVTQTLVMQILNAPQLSNVDNEEQTFALLRSILNTIPNREIALQLFQDNLKPLWKNDQLWNSTFVLHAISATKQCIEKSDLDDLDLDGVKHGLNRASESYERFRHYMQIVNDIDTDFFTDDARETLRQRLRETLESLRNDETNQSAQRNPQALLRSIAAGVCFYSKIADQNTDAMRIPIADLVQAAMKTDDRDTFQVIAKSISASGTPEDSIQLLQHPFCVGEFRMGIINKLARDLNYNGRSEWELIQLRQ